MSRDLLGVAVAAVVAGCAPSSCTDARDDAGPDCDPAQIRCDGRCWQWDELKTDAHCGECGNACIDGETCEGDVQAGFSCGCRELTASCVDGAPACETDLAASVEHCGACGARCAAERACLDAACECGSWTECPRADGGETCLGTACAFARTTPDAGVLSLYAIADGGTVVDVEVPAAAYSYPPRTIVAVRCDGTERRLTECGTIVADEPCPDDVGMAVLCAADGAPSVADAGGGT